MAEKPSWQNQSYAKGGSQEAAPSQMNSKLMQGSTTSMHSKIAKPSQPMGGLVSGGSMKKAPLRMADGGSVDDETYNSKSYQDDKAAGLEASKGESVGFFERMRMGNIDDPTSEAYRRFGAGRGEIERMKSAPDESAAETKRLASTAPAPTEEAPKISTAADFQRTDKDTTPVPMPSKPAASKPVKTKPLRVSTSDDATDTGDETARLAKRAPAPVKTAPAPVPNTAAERDKKYREDMDNTPLMRGVKAVKDWFTTPHGPKIKSNPPDMPSIYASKEEWAAYRERQAKREAEKKAP